MGILSRVFKSFASSGYTPDQTEAKRLSESRIGSTIAKVLRQARETTTLIHRARVVDWRMWTPNPDSLDDSAPILNTGWGEGMPQTMTERTLCLWILSIMKDIRVFSGITRRTKGSFGRKYLRSFWEGNIRRLFSDPECCWNEIYNECYTFIRHTLPEQNANLLANQRKIRKLTRSGVVRHLVSTTYAGTNPRGNEFFFARLDGDWFSRTKPYLKIRSKVDAEKLIARGYLFGWDKSRECECRIPVYCAFVRSLDTYYNADRIPEFETVQQDQTDSVQLLNLATGILTDDERRIVECIARNPNATHIEIARMIGLDGGIGTGWKVVGKSLQTIREKANKPEWASLVQEFVAA